VNFSLKNLTSGGNNFNFHSPKSRGDTTERAPLLQNIGGSTPLPIPKQATEMLVCACECVEGDGLRWFKGLSRQTQPFSS